MKSVKVVIVDDSPFSISIIRDILEGNGLDVVGEASNLNEVLEVVKEKKPQLVTMDMTLPGTNGLECTRAIHKIDPNIKVIVISSLMDDEIVKEAKESKVSGYIQKPIEPETLINVIKKVMSGDRLFEELKDINFNIFKEAFIDSLNKFTKTIGTFGEEKKSNTTEVSRGISIAIGIIGSFCGRMVMDLSYDTANGITKFILKREPKDMNETLNVMAEFANIVTGNACSMINRRNKVFGLRVAPPTAFYGKSLNISQTMLETLSVIIDTEFGEFYLNVGFKRGEGEWM